LLVDALSVTVRALSFVALFQAAGTTMFLGIFGHQLVKTDALVRRLGIASAACAAALVVLHYALEPARMGGELAGMTDPSLQKMVIHSSATVALLLRLVGLALIMFGLVRRAPLHLALGLVGTALVLIAFTTVGHTSSQPDRFVLAFLLLVHLFVGAFWFGALLPLVAISARESPALASAIVERFSSLAVWVVPAVFVAGVAMTSYLLPDLAALGSSYGRLLVVKVSGFTILMGLAALNKWRFGPALGRDDGRVVKAFQRSVQAEFALIVAILCVTAALTTFYSPES
jgi:putative copper export protein